MVRCITCNVLHMRQFCRFLYCLSWFDTVECNRLPSPKNEMNDDAVFSNRFHYQLTMFGIRVLIWLSGFFHTHIAYVDRYWQNHRSILPNFLLFAWFDTLEFNRLPSSNNKIYDDADFADRFRYQLAMFEIRVFIWLSWLLHGHIAHISDGAKIIAEFCRISYCSHDLIRLNSIVGYVQTTRCTMIWFSMIDSDINWLCLKCVYSRGYVDSLILILHMK